MLTTKEFCGYVVDLNLSVQFQNAGGMRIIIWKQKKDENHLVPVADIRTDQTDSYSVDYPYFKEGLDYIDQTQLSILLMKYADTPVENR